MPRLAFALLLVLLAAETARGLQGGKKPADVVKVKAVAGAVAANGEQTVSVTLKIDKPWHLYANPVGNADLKTNQTTVTVTAADEPETVKVEYPKGKVVKDKDAGDYKVYEGEVTIKATVKRKNGAKGPLDVAVKVYCCSDSTCLPPATLKATAEEKK